MNYIVQEFRWRDWDTKRSFQGFFRSKHHVWNPYECCLWLVVTPRYLVRDRKSKTEQRTFILFNQAGSSCSSHNLAVKEAFLFSRVISSYNTENTPTQGWEDGWCFYKLMNSVPEHSCHLCPLVLLSHVCLSFKKSLHLDKCCPIMSHWGLRALQSNKNTNQNNFNHRWSWTHEISCCLLLNRKPYFSLLEFLCIICKSTTYMCKVFRKMMLKFSLVQII